MGVGQVSVGMDELLGFLGLDKGHRILGIFDDTGTRRKGFTFMVEGPTMPTGEDGKAAPRVRLTHQEIVMVEILEPDGVGGG